MKTKIIAIAGILAALLFHVGCGEKDNSGINYAGNWVNEKKDTVYFYNDAKLLTYKSFNSNHTILYSYNIKQDSIFLYPSHSSNSNDWTGYPIQWGTNEFTLFNYNNVDKDVYKRLN